jgi:hypothetical protein
MGQALLYYNRVSKVTKDHILEKGMGSPACYACYRKEMLGWIHEKMAIQESTPGGGRFFASSSTIARNSTSVSNDPCILSEDYLTATKNDSWDNAHTYLTTTKNDSWDNAHTFDSSSKGERLGKEPSTLVQRAQRTIGRLDG